LIPVWRRKFDIGFGRWASKEILQLKEVIIIAIATVVSIIC
jgi:hypothetical protein